MPGFAVEPEKSWTWSGAGQDASLPRTSFNWLSDTNGLQKDFPQARIMLYQYNSQYKGPNNVDLTLQFIASDFLHDLQEKREVCRLISQRLRNTGADL